MENAGRGCVDVLERLGIDGPVVILCGKGNNAGDGFVIARHLEIRGYACRVLLLCPPQRTPRRRGNKLRHPAKDNVPIVEVYQLQRPRRRAYGCEPVISPRGPDFHSTSTPRWLDRRHARHRRRRRTAPAVRRGHRLDQRPSSQEALAVDVPSGLDCDTGQPAAHTVRADHTCTFAAMKIGFTQPAAKPFTGTVHVCDIGVPPQLIDEVARLCST